MCRRDSKLEWLELTDEHNLFVLSVLQGVQRGGNKRTECEPVLCLAKAQMLIDDGG